MQAPRIYGRGGLPVEARLERLEHDLRRLRQDMEHAETVLGERSSLVELLRGCSPLLPPPRPRQREQQLSWLFD